MNLGIESETLEFKKTTGELEKAMDNIASMLNKHGYGTVYFGVDPSGEVIGQQISSSSLDDVARKIKEAIKPTIYPEIKHEVIDGKDVIRVDFSGKEKPYSSYGRYFKRVYDRTEEMTPAELKTMMSLTDENSLWENNLTEYGLEAIDSFSLETFYKKAVACGRLESLTEYSEEELLTGLGLYEKGRLTNAGYYLFSNRKPVVLKLAVFVTDERINFSDIDRIEDNIFNLINKGFSYIKEHINWSVKTINGTSRIEVPEIPIEAIREIVVNSFAHADYRAISENEIDITPSRIEIYNPGEFPTGLSPEMFAKQQIKSMPRNKVILSTLYKSKDVEIFGSGFRKVYSYCENEGINVNSFSRYGGFSFIFYRKGYVEELPQYVIKGNNDLVTDNPLSTSDRVYKLLKEDPYQTREVLAQKAGKTVRTIQRALDKLTKDNKINRKGSNKKGYWDIL